MKPMGPLEKVAARINRAASGAPAGRKESDTDAQRAARRKEYGTAGYRAPNGTVPKKWKPGAEASGALGKAIDDRIKRGLGE